MASEQVQSVPSAARQEAGTCTMASGEPNRGVATKDVGVALPGSFDKVPESGTLGGGLQRTTSGAQHGMPGGLQRTMSRDLGGAGAQPGGLQRTMSRDLGAAGAQPGGLQRTMSRDVGSAGAQPGGLQRTMSGAPQGGLQRTMSRDLGMGGAQPSGGGLQRTMSKGLGNAPRDPLRPRKTPGKAERVPRPAGGQDVLPAPRQNTAST